MFQRLSFCCFFALILAASPASRAQETEGNMHGYAFGPDGHAMPGVRITISGSRLQGTRSSLTDADGVYAVPLLPPGDGYRASAEKEGLGHCVHEGVSVLPGRATRVDFHLGEGDDAHLAPPGSGRRAEQPSFTESITHEELQTLPLDHAFSGAFDLAPGVDRSDIDCAVTSGGASALENVLYIEGMNATDPVMGFTYSGLPLEFVQEFEVITGGAGVEYGASTGAFFQAVLPTGTNEFHGMLYGTYTDESLLASRQDTDFGSYSNDDNFNRRRLGMIASGPIVKDRLWFFAGLCTDRTVFHHDEKIRNYNNYDYRAGRKFRRDEDEKERSNPWALKLSARLNDRHTLTLAALSDQEKAELAAGWPDSLFGSVNRMARTRTGGIQTMLSWSASWSDRFFQETSAGWRKGRSDVMPWLGGEAGYGSPALVSGDYVYATAVSPGFGPFTIEERETYRIATKGTFLLGRHRLTAGLDWEETDWKTTRGYTGGRLTYLYYGVYYDPRNGQSNDMGDPANYYYKQSYWYEHERLGERGSYGAAFLQDAWSPADGLTITAGLRYERNRIGSRNGLSVVLRSLSPRIGFAWDALGNGRSRFYGHWGRYFLRLPLNVAQSMDRKDRRHYTLRAGYGDGFVLTRRIDGADPVGVLPGTKNQYDDEILMGFEFEVRPDLAVGVRAVQRELGRLLDDVGYYDPATGNIRYFLANPGPSTPLTYTDETGSVLSWDWYLDTASYPTPSRIYRALEFTLRKRYANGWFLGGSYTRSRLTGNTAGLYDPTLEQMAPLQSQEWDIPYGYMLENRGGILPTDRTHRLKLYGGARWDFGLSAGAVFRLQSGTPLSKIMEWDSSSVGYGLRYIMPRGRSGRLPHTWTLDLHLEYAVSIWKTELALFADVFNVTNNQKPVQAYQYSSDWYTSAYWGETTANQDPRRARLGFRWSF